MKNMRRVCAVILLSLAALCACRQSREATRDRYLASGKEYMKKRDYSRAVLAFKNAARTAPKDPEPLYEIGVASEDLGDLRTAITAYRQALQVNQGYVPAKLRLSELMAQTSDASILKDARSQLEDLLKTNAPTTEMLDTLALAEMKLGNTADAIQKLQQALSKSSGQLAPYAMLAEAKLIQNDANAAEDVLKKACSDLPKSPDALRLLGDFYTQRNKAPEAEAAFRRALQLDPKNGATQMDLGRLELALGRKPEAEQTFKQVAALENYKNVYGLFLLQQGRRDEAIAEFEKLTKQNPDNRVFRSDLILAYGSENRIGDVNRVLDAALKRNPKDSDALLSRGELYIDLGKYAEAAIDLNKVRELLPNSPAVHYAIAKLDQNRGDRLTYRQELSEVLSLDPTLLAVRLELAQDYISAKSAQAARDVLNAAPDAQKQTVSFIVERNWVSWALGDMAEMRKGIDQGLAQQKTPDLLIQEGLWKLRSKNSAGARTSLEQALNINPSDLLALEALSQSYPENAPLALQTVKEYAAKQPKSAPLQEFLGVLLARNGDAQGARSAFLAAKASDPRFTGADLSLVQLDVAASHLDDAVGRLQSVLSREPNNVTAELWLGNLDVMKGSKAAAVQQFQKVVQAQPNNAQALNNLGYLLAESGNQTDTALKYAQEAVELAPEHPAYYDTLGWILYQKGVYDGAVKYLEKATAQNTRAVWKYHLAMAYTKAGDRARGQSTLTAALKLNPALPEAKLAERVIGQSH